MRACLLEKRELPELWNKLLLENSREVSADAKGSLYLVNSEILNSKKGLVTHLSKSRQI